MNNINCGITTTQGIETLSVFVDDTELSKYVSKHADDESYLGLWSAWMVNENEMDQELIYIKSLLEDKVSANIPILLCPDDFDFSCTIIFAKVVHTDDEVIWSNIGVLQKNYDIKEWRESGLMNLSTWTVDDYEKYAFLIPPPFDDLEAWKKIWSENWIDEESRRIKNYIDPFFNDDSNIEWFNTPELSFDPKFYGEVIQRFIDYQR